MKTVRFVSCVVVAVGISMWIVDSAQAIKILFHGREAGAGDPPEPTFRGDPAAFDHLQAVFGEENVDFMQGIDAAADGSSANGYDVVFISATMASSNTRDKYEDSPVGIVIGEHANTSCCTVGNFAMVTMTGDSGGGTKIRNEIDIMDPSHPIAAGLSGHVRFVSSDVPSNDPILGTQWGQYGAGPLGAGVVEIARWDTTDQPLPDPVERVIFAADVGAALLGDGSPGVPATAAGRRVFFGGGDYLGSDLTADGYKLFDAAITWAAAKPVAGVPGDYNGNGTVDAADYVAWRDGGPLANEVATPGSITAEDYNEWRARFGNIAGLGSGNSAAAVPEPSGCLLAAIAWLIIASMRRGGAAETR
jgi:hypothetical protein